MNSQEREREIYIYYEKVAWSLITTNKSFNAVITEGGRNIRAYKKKE